MVFDAPHAERISCHLKHCQPFDSVVGCSTPLTPPLSFPPIAEYVRQWIWSALVQIMACRLFGDKPLSKPMLSYCQLDPYEQTSLKFQSKYTHFHSRKCISSPSLQLHSPLFFSYTFTVVQDNTDQHWYFLRYSLCKEYHERPPLAPPIIILSHIYLFIRQLLGCCNVLKSSQYNDFSKCYYTHYKLVSNPQCNDFSKCYTHCKVPTRPQYNDFSKWYTHIDCKMIMHSQCNDFSKCYIHINCKMIMHSQCNDLSKWYIHVDSRMIMPSQCNDLSKWYIHVDSKMIRHSQCNDFSKWYIHIDCKMIMHSQCNDLSKWYIHIDSKMIMHSQCNDFSIGTHT